MEGSEFMFSVEGTIVSGLNEATEFMKKEVYKKQYLEKLGFMPYMGTLNIKLKNNITLDIENELAPYLKKINGDDELGDVFFLNAVLYTKNNENIKKGAILFPTKTIYKTDTLEFITEEKLKDTINLVDGSHVSIKIET